MDQQYQSPLITHISAEDINSQLPTSKSNKQHPEIGRKKWNCRMMKKKKNRESTASHLRMVSSFTQFLAYQVYSCTSLKAAAPENPCSPTLSKKKKKNSVEISLYWFTLSISHIFSALTNSQNGLPSFPFKLSSFFTLSWFLFLLQKPTPLWMSFSSSSRIPSLLSVTTTHSLSLTT